MHDTMTLYFDGAIVARVTGVTPENYAAKRARLECAAACLIPEYAHWLNDGAENRELWAAGFDAMPWMTEHTNNSKRDAAKQDRINKAMRDGNRA